MKSILGVILCGGESKRMGTDKGLMPAGDTIRSKLMADKLSSFGLPVVFSINKNQFVQYSYYLPERYLIIDDSALKGPAGGLLTIHKEYPARDILLLACDMLEMDDGTIKKLLDVYSSENNYDFYVYQDENYAQPLCGIYTARGINKLLSNIEDQSLTNISMQYVLNNGNTRRIEMDNRKAFENFNFPVR